VYFLKRLLYCLRGVSNSEPSSASARRKSGPKRPANRRRIVQLLLLFVASVIVVDGLVGDRGLLAMMRARREYDSLAANVSRQRAENAQLAEQIRRLREDPLAIEEVARRDLGLIKPGEKVFIIKDIQPPKP